MQFGLEEERIGEVEFQSILDGFQVSLLCGLVVEEREGIDDGGGQCLAGLAPTGEPIFHGEFLVDSLLAGLPELPEVLPLLPLRLFLALLRPALLLLLLSLFSLVLALFQALESPPLHLSHLRVELLDEQFRLQRVILGDRVQILGREFVLVEQEVVLLALAPIDDVLLQLVLLQSQLLVLKPVVLLPPLVTGENGLQLTGVGGSGRQDHLPALALPALPPVDVSLEDAVDQPPHLRGVGQVEVRHPEDGSLAELPSWAAIGGIA